MKISAFNFHYLQLILRLHLCFTVAQNHRNQCCYIEPSKNPLGGSKIVSSTSDFMQKGVDVNMSGRIHQRSGSSFDSSVVSFTGKILSYLFHIGGPIDLGVWRIVTSAGDCPRTARAAFIFGLEHGHGRHTRDLEDDDGCEEDIEEDQWYGRPQREFSSGSCCKVEELVEKLHVVMME